MDFVKNVNRRRRIEYQAIKDCFVILGEVKREVERWLT